MPDAPPETTPLYNIFFVFSTARNVLTPQNRRQTQAGYGTFSRSAICGGIDTGVTRHCLWGFVPRKKRKKKVKIILDTDP